MENKPLDFIEFIQKFYPTYVIDEFNAAVVEKVNLWAMRDEKFNSKAEALHIDKGILLMGAVGTGKTDLFRLLKVYLNQYTKSPYAFSYNVVWEFTGEFNISGYESLRDQEKGNRYYDELCLTHHRTGLPEKEQAMHYGSKLLIGEEIIMLRYNSFKSNAYQTHFSTNASLKDLKNCYGERAYSRLTEMCNFIPLIGEDRREGGQTTFYNNAMIKKQLVSTPVSEQEIAENKATLNREYANYLETGEVTDISVILYPLFNIYGCHLPHTEPSTLESKKDSILKFYENLKESNALSIFNEIDVPTNQIIKDLVKANKILTDTDQQVIDERIRQKQAIIKQKYNIK